MAFARARICDYDPPIAINARPRKRASVARARGWSRAAASTRARDARDATSASARAHVRATPRESTRAVASDRAASRPRAHSSAPPRHRLKTIRDTARRRSASNCEVREMRKRARATTIDATIFMRANARSTARERAMGRCAARSNGTAPAPRMRAGGDARSLEAVRRRRATAGAGRRGRRWGREYAGNGAARGGGRADAETRADGGGTRARGTRGRYRARATRGTGSGESGRRAPARCAVMDGR